MIEVWERHRLDAENLGNEPGDVKHEFERTDYARQFIQFVENGHPAFTHYERLLQLDDYTLAIDFGSWSDFFLVRATWPITPAALYGGGQK